MKNRRYDHPAGQGAEQRRRVAGSAVVVDTQALAEWWETERAAGREAEARAQFYRTASVCLLAVTATLVVAIGWFMVTA